MCENGRILKLFSTSERGLPFFGVDPPLSTENRGRGQRGRSSDKRNTPDPKTILVVDDNPEILAFVARLLCSDGQTRLTAVDGEHALAVSQDHRGEIHFVSRPAIRALMMSGFGGGKLVLNEGWHFLAKPFIGSRLRQPFSSRIHLDFARDREAAHSRLPLVQLRSCHVQASAFSRHT